MLIDANVLVYAYRKDAERHGEYLDWLEEALSSEPAFGVVGMVLSSFIRIVTHPGIFAKPTSTQDAFAFAEFIRNSPNAVRASPQENHWEIFHRLSRQAGAKGNLIPDAFLAALAIESGGTWYTADRDFARFQGLKWRHPLDA